MSFIERKELNRNSTPSSMDRGSRKIWAIAAGLAAASSFVIKQVMEESGSKDGSNIFLAIGVIQTFVSGFFYGRLVDKD